MTAFWSFSITPSVTETQRGGSCVAVWLQELWCALRVSQGHPECWNRYFQEGGRIGRILMGGKEGEIKAPPSLGWYVAGFIEQYATAPNMLSWR